MAKKQTNPVSSVDIENEYVSKSKSSAVDTEFKKIRQSMKIDIKCKNAKQKEFLKNLKNEQHEICIGTGAPGTGKSYISIGYALKSLKEGKAETITIIVPTCEASSALSIGLLPGTINEKIRPFMDATMYTMKKILTQGGTQDAESIVKYLTTHKKINYEIISYIRGKTFDKTIMLIEEAENLSKEEILLAITRIGEESKLIMSGDYKQCDRTYNIKMSGLEHAANKLCGFDEVGITEFSEDDVVRNPLITKILKNW